MIWASHVIRVISMRLWIQVSCTSLPLCFNCPFVANRVFFSQNILQFNVSKFNSKLQSYFICDQATLHYKWCYWTVHYNRSTCQSSCTKTVEFLINLFKCWQRSHQVLHLDQFHNSTEWAPTQNEWR